jgi:hypothetical protein
MRLMPLNAGDGSHATWQSPTPNTRALCAGSDPRAAAALRAEHCVPLLPRVILNIFVLPRLDCASGCLPRLTCASGCLRCVVAHAVGPMMALPAGSATEIIAIIKSKSSHDGDDVNVVWTRRRLSRRDLPNYLYFILYILRRKYSLTVFLMRCSRYVPVWFRKIL